MLVVNRWKGRWWTSGWRRLPVSRPNGHQFINDQTGLAARAPRSAARRMQRATLGVVVASLVVVGSAIAVALSRPPGDAVDSMWADDGVPFFAEAHSLGLRSLVTPYTGYLHLYPRCAAFVTLLFPIRDAPAVFAAAGAMATAATALSLFLAGQDLIRGPVLRLAAALTIPLLPTAGADPEGNVANAHWWLNMTVVLLAFRPDRDQGASRRAGNIAVLVAAVFAAGSDPTVVVVAPVLVWRYLRARRRGDSRQCRAELLVLAVVLAVCALQFAVAATHDRDASTGRPNLSGLVDFYARTVTVPLFAGLRPGGPSLALGVASTVACLSLLAGGVCWEPRRGWRLAGLGGVGILLFAPPPTLKWNPPMLAVSAAGMPIRARYTVTAATLLFIALVGAADIARRRLGVSGSMAAPLALLAALALAAALYLPAFSAGRLREPSWSAQVTTAQTVCRSAQPQRRLYLQGAPVLPQWEVPITCAQLLAHP